MKARGFATAFIALAFTPRASAHRLDEYLQATTLALKGDQVEAEMVLTPGVRVVGQIMSVIDTDRDGLVSDAEKGIYAQRVLGDLSLVVDGNRRVLRLASVTFPSLTELKDGLGGIRIEFTADLTGPGVAHALVLENKHQRALSTYLVNSLVPEDPAIRIASQDRNYEQSRYEVDFSRSDPGAGGTLPWKALTAALLISLAPIAASAFARRRKYASI